MSAQAITLRSEIAPPRLDQLAASIRQHHEGVLDALRRTLENAVAAGDALAEAHELIPHGAWQPWIDANIGFGVTTANLYIRIARFREELALVGVTSVSEAKRYLTDQGLGMRVYEYPESKLIEVQALGEQGLSHREIARRAGVAYTTVTRWLREGPTPKPKAKPTTGERPPKPAPKPSAPPITDDMIEGMARWLTVRTGAKLTDKVREQATEALRVALNYKKRQAG